jgi:hypothetical protein
MNDSTRSNDIVSSQVIEELSFQASILALQTAVETASQGRQPESMRTDEPLKIPVRRAVRPATGTETLHRADMKGL